MRRDFACCYHCPCAGPERIGHSDACEICLNNKASWDRVRDEARIRAELHDRLDRCDDNDHGAAFGWLTDNHPDLVREALDETGAPS